MISIIIPTLNEESVLERTLKNLKQGNSFPFEIIVSDGKSTDRTCEIAEQNFVRVEKYTGQKRQTIAGGKNLGARVAKYDYFLFQDADVIIPDPEQFFCRTVKFFENEPELVGITVSLRVLPEYETIFDRFMFKCINLLFIFQNNILRQGAASGEFQMIKRDAFYKLNGYNEKLVVAEDIDMFARLAKIGKTRMVQELTVFHTGRRAHKIGWPRLLMTWWINAFSLFFFKKSASKEWRSIR